MPTPASRTQHALPSVSGCSFPSQRRRPLPPALLLLIAVLLVGACSDAGSPLVWTSTPQALWEASPIPPIHPLLCLGPDEGPTPFPPDLAQGTTTAAGTLPGSFSVTSTGEATYTIPVPTLPGRAGIEPSLAITYDSAQGEGLLGIGFHLQGLPSVERCPRNVAQDGHIASVRDAEDDALCLDGQRLVPVDPQPGRVAREYRTFPDSFTRVEADFAESEGWPAERGPKRLRAHSKAGLIYEYGGESSGRVLAQEVVRSWLLTRLSDRDGNTMEVVYRNDLHPKGYTVEHAPQRITYTGHPSVPASRTVEFTYGPLESADVRVLYARGMELRRSLSLRSIQMFGPGQVLARELRLAYGHGPATGRLRLEAVRECAGDGTCKPPTRFTWHTAGAAGYRQQQTPVGMPLSERGTLMTMDVSGDGLDDVVTSDMVVEAGAEQPITRWSVALNRSQELTPAFFEAAVTGQEQPHFIDAEPPYQPELGTPLDYDHDGRMDLFLHDVYGQALTWEVLLSDGDGTFTRRDTGIPRPFTMGMTPAGLRSADASAHLVDVDGDGMVDLLQCHRSAHEQLWYLHRWTAAAEGFAPHGDRVHALTPYPCHAELHAVDVDADGRVDLLMQELVLVGSQVRAGSQYVAFSYELFDGSWTHTLTGLRLTPPGDRVFFLDVNGDGLPDAVQSSRDDEQLYTSMNTGTSFAAPVPSLATPTLGAARFVRFASVLDHNADGRQDLLLAMGDGGSESLPAWKVLQATGEVGPGTFEIVHPGLPMGIVLQQDELPTPDHPLTPRVTDVNGDGAQDLLYAFNNQVHVFESVLGQEDLLAAVTDGMNAHDPEDAEYLPNVQIRYDHLIDRARTTAGFEDTTGIPSPEQRTYRTLEHSDEDQCRYPVRCVVGHRRVVSGYVLNNGADRPRTFQVVYRNGRHHRLGRGFLGFGTRIVRDLDTGAGTAEVYDNVTFDGAFQAFPFRGQVQRSWRWSPSLPLDAHSAEPVSVELLTTRSYPVVIPTQTGTYFTLSLLEGKSRHQGTFSPGSGKTLEEAVGALEGDLASRMSDTLRTVSDFDLYGNILAEQTQIDGVDLELSVTRSFDNDPLSWRLGEQTRETTCSKAGGETQCRVMHRSYDGRGHVRLERVGGEPFDPEMQLDVWFSRDALGNIHSTRSRDGTGQVRATCTSYDALGLTPYAHRNLEGHQSYTRYDPALGVLRASVDPNGLVSRWAYDGFGRVTLESLPGRMPTIIRRTWMKDGGAAGNAWNLKVRTSSVGGQDETAQFDGLGREVRWWWQALDVGEEQAPRMMQEVAFDARGEHLAWRSLPIAEPAPPGSVQVRERWQYDGMGRVLRHVTPWGAETTHEYIGRDEVITAPGQAVTRIATDPLGRPTAVGDPEGGVTRYTYGPFGGLREVTTPAGAVTLTERDAFGRVRRQVSPDRGVSTAHYDGYGQKISSLDAAGRAVTTRYDTLGRIFRQVDEDGVTEFRWDDAQHGVGQLALVVSPDGHRLRYGFDHLGRPMTTTLEIGGESFTSRLSYDLSGRLKRIEYPSAPGIGSFAVEREYDPHGRLRALKDAGSGAEFWRATAIDAGNRITGERFGGGTATTLRTFDAARERVSRIETQAAGGHVQELSYLWNDRRKLVERSDGLHANVERFRYDLLDRLTCAQFGLINAALCERPFTYGPDGNLLQKPGVGAYEYDPAQPHAVVRAGSAFYGYDAVGNQTSRPGATIAYSAFDLPKRITLTSGDTVDFAYDGLQQRVRKTTATQEIVSFGELYERVTDVVTGAVEHRYHVRNDERVVTLVRRSIAQGTRTLHVHVDHLGSIDVLTDGVTGSVAEQRSYDAFGAPRHPDWGSGQPPSPHELSSLGFTGHEADLDLGLVNMKGRIYDPKLGRFLTPDPLVPRPLFGQSWNSYSYVLNSPLSLVDPSGFQEQPPATEDGCSQGCTVWVFGPPREPKPPAPPKVVEGNLEEAAGAGSTQAPVDVGTSGVRSGWSPQLPATLQTLARGDAIARRIMDGVRLGMTRMLLESAKLGILGGTSRVYVAYTTLTAAWNGYKESGIPGALDAVNPASQMVEAGVEAYEAAAAEDWESAGASLFKAGSIGMSILATAVGVGGAVTATVGSTAKAAGRTGRVAGGAKRGPKIDSAAPHNARIRAEADALEATGNKVVAGGGREKERLILTPGGHKSGRRPDILYETPDGALRGRNVGRTRTDGTPVRREIEALDDLNGPGGLPTDFVPYDR
ncbi:FG-GAP-like repeat-containing protein [Chondromyces crocatus]|uniref:Type IV secretion protein Rhs n=1 Tax=Chondromyces crocatus TaxID=52 RepID=A0A0K1EQ07_CHOCO|nr:FG-GAP-like repeat-containing protein [Chondromyces crocatus]AKT42727.1 type IV secretion protein Rhs [Chondromyces crocatus]